MDFTWLHRLILHSTHMKSPPGGNAFNKLEKKTILNIVCIIYFSSSGHKLPRCSIFCIRLSLDMSMLNFFGGLKRGEKKLTL